MLLTEFKLGRFIFASILLAFALFLWTPAERYFEIQFLKHQILKKEKIFLKDLTKFNWDYACIETAYGAGNSEWHRDRNEGVDIPVYLQDGEWGIVFVKNNSAFEVLTPISSFRIKDEYTLTNNSSRKNYCIPYPQGYFIRTVKEKPYDPEYTLKK